MPQISRLSFKWAVAIVAAAPLSPGAGGAQQPRAASITIPSKYIEDRFFVRPILESGDTLNLFIDTGANDGYLKLEIAQRPGSPLSVLAVRVDTARRTADTTWGAPWPRLRGDPPFPAPALGAANLMYVPTGRRAAPGPIDKWLQEDGFLGTTWFQDRVWTLDYPGRRITYHPGGPPPLARDARKVPLGFKVDSAGKRGIQYPRIGIEVDGEPLDLLFDTGATTVLSDSAMGLLRDGRSPARATSFIMRAVFDRWRTKHPDWRVIVRAEGYSGMETIEVPSISIAGWRTGPVWFTVRNDNNYRNFSRFFDRPIVGALGGNALKSFRVTLDYPGAVAVFEQVR